MSCSGSHPGPRRKSCGECIKAKRRCDQTLPKCSRCERQRRMCDYGLPARFQSPSVIPYLDDFQLSPLDSGVADLTTLADDLSPVADDPLSLGHLLQTVESRLNALPTFDLQKCLEHSSYAVSAVNSRSLELGVVDTWALIQSRLPYGIDQLKQSVRLMATEGRTPWSHPLLYETSTPRSMQTVQAACAYYVTLSDANREQVWRYVGTCVDDLLATPRPADPAGLLAYTQSLLLYQIMRLFGGGFKERAQAGAVMHDLEMACLALAENIATTGYPQGAPVFYPTAASRAFWRSWILAESQRRTLIVSYFLLVLYSHFVGGEHYCEAHTEFRCDWTASAHLWNAETLLDFTKVWTEKKPYVIRDMDFTDLIATGAADDLEPFGKMLVVSALGVEEVQGWLHTRGGGVL